MSEPGNETLFKKLAISSQAGDAPAYNELLVGLEAFLKNYLRKRIFEKSQIEDIVQEVLLAVHRSLQTYDGKKLFMGWFMGLVEHKIVDYIRKTQKHSELLSLENISSLLVGAHLDTDLKLDLEQAISQLGEKERKILNALKIEGQSIEAVASELKLSEGNIRVIAHRAYEQLRKKLGANP